MPISLNPKEHKYASLIEDARMQASNEWEEEFVSDVKSRIDKNYNYELSDAQINKLQEIANGKEDDLFSRPPRFNKR